MFPSHRTCIDASYMVLQQFLLLWPLCNILRSRYCGFLMLAVHYGLHFAAYYNFVLSMNMNFVINADGYMRQKSACHQQ